MAANYRYALWWDGNSEFEFYEPSVVGPIIAVRRYKYGNAVDVRVPVEFDHMDGALEALRRITQQYAEHNSATRP
jgi:hypothetical protein